MYTQYHTTSRCIIFTSYVQQPSYSGPLAKSHLKTSIVWMSTRTKRSASVALISYFHFKAVYFSSARKGAFNIHLYPIIAYSQHPKLAMLWYQIGNKCVCVHPLEMSPQRLFPPLSGRFSKKSCAPRKQVWTPHYWHVCVIFQMQLPTLEGTLSWSWWDSSTLIAGGHNINGKTV